MPEWIAETLKYIGPFGVFCVAVLYLLQRDRANRKNNNPGSNIRWQTEMKAAQGETNKTLGRIESGMTEACRLLALMEDRRERRPPP